MTKKAPDAQIPEGLPETARPYWPTLEQWPTARKARAFVKATRKKPEERLAVLTGLRRYSQSDLSVPLAWVGAYVPVVLAMASIPIGVPAWSIVAIVGAGIVIAFFLVRFLVVSAQVDERRQNAVAWLRALEDEMSRRSR